jgi:signal transduction histidine kinase
MHSFLGAPVTARGRVFGNIYLTDKQGAPEFSEDDEAALEVLAAHAGVAVENARLYEEATRARAELERLAVMEERERIARELHDGAIQALFAVGMGLQGAGEMSGDEETRARIAQAVDEIDRVIRDLRNYIFGLRPGIVADRQLDRAIRELTADFEAKSGVTTVVEVDPQVAAELTARAGDVIQLTREALSNVGRHSGAATCRVGLRREGGVAVLEIDDDGAGFAEEEIAPGNGLRNMRERAEALGGETRVSSEPGAGTTVSIRIPL